MSLAENSWNHRYGGAGGAQYSTAQVGSLADNIVTSDVVQKGNSLSAKMSVTSYNCPSFSTKTSPEFMINSSAMFQIKVITAQSKAVYNNLIFILFAKRQIDDDLTYKMKLTIEELGITDKCFTSDDGTWHLIHENKKQQFSFEVHVSMEVMPCVSSFAELHDDTELTDFELRGKDGSVRVHRAVLAAASPVLRRMLAGGAWRETTVGHVDVPGTSKSTLEHLKTYMYLHQLPEYGLEQLLLLSSYYIMPDLEQKCVDRLVQNVSAEDVCEMIEFAAKNKVTRLLVAVLECVQNRAVSVADIRAHVSRAQ